MRGQGVVVRAEVGHRLPGADMKVQHHLRQGGKGVMSNEERTVVRPRATKELGGRQADAGKVPPGECVAPTLLMGMLPGTSGSRSQLA